MLDSVTTHVEVVGVDLYVTHIVGTARTRENIDIARVWPRVIPLIWA